MDENKSGSVKADTGVFDSNLSTMYMFNNFVLCDGNMLVYSAAQALMTGDNRFNPLCIVGPGGNGKTHLLQAVGNAIADQNQGKNVLYLTAEEFVNECISTIRSGKQSLMAAFREKIRSVNVLLFDDFQFMMGKESSLEELSHDIDALYRRGSIIILASDRQPKDTDIQNTHLCNLITAGYVAEISAPDQAMKESIVREKAKKAGLLLRDEVIEYIARSCKSNVSEIEGAIKSMIAYSELTRPVIMLKEAKEILKTGYVS